MLQWSHSCKDLCYHVFVKLQMWTKPCSQKPSEMNSNFSKTTSKPRPSFMHMTSVHSLPSRTPASFEVDWVSSCWEM